MTTKILPITLGIIILVLLGLLIFLPGRRTNPAPTATSTSSGTNSDGSVPAPSTTLPGDTNTTSTLHAYISSKGRTVNIYLASGQKVISPLTVTGNVPAGWAFEASFPAQILDSTGKVLGQGAARVPNWMSTSTAWFGITISFSKPATSNGVLLLRNDNPSGLPPNADEVRIPVAF